MRKIMSSVLLVLTVALLVVTAQAQSRPMLKGEVPFNFIVGDRSVPAGQYTIRAMDNRIQAWYDQEGRGLFVIPTQPTGETDDSNPTKLVFHRYGDIYFLAEVWNEGNSYKIMQSSRRSRIAQGKSYETIAVLMNVPK